MKALLLGVLLLLLGTLPGLAVQAPGTVAPDPSYGDVPDDPSLPRVLLIGDSISMAYTIPVRRVLQGRANVHRIPMNGSSTDVGMANLDAWLGNGKWDVIHFNWGLHDLTVLLGQGGLKNDGSYLVPLDRYQKNLEELVRKLKRTGATLIWGTTTPIPHVDKHILLRISGDEITYNAVARKIMDINGIAIDDLYEFALPRLAQIQKPANVHFTDEGSEELAKQVAASLLDALKTRQRKRD